jgi:6-pyruvoyltetrahydropterin/6-carboxytetrahydropterin synthase
MFEVSVEETFAAAHALRGYHGKCEHLHGHNYKVEVTLAGEHLDPTGLLVDFVQVKQWVHSVAERLDHRLLNEIPPFNVVNPSAENLAKYFFEQLTNELVEFPSVPQVHLVQVRIWETETSAATYRP